MATLHTPTKSEIESMYSINAHEIEAYASIYRSQAAFRIVSSDGTALLLKPVRPPNEDIARLHSRLERLAQSGYHGAPKLIATRRGEWTCDLGGNPYYAVEWIDGEPMQCNPSHAAALGRALAHIHQTPCNGQSRREGPRKTPLLFWSQKAKRAEIRLHRLQQQTGPCAEWFRTHGQESTAMSQQALTILSVPRVQRAFSAGYKSPAWVHGDITCPNAIVTTQGDMRLIDWELVHAGHPLFELTKAIANTTQFKPAIIRALLKGYTSVRPLTQADKDVVRAWFRFPREAWDVCRYALQGTPPTDFSILELTWSDRQRAIRTLDRWAQTSH